MSLIRFLLIIMLAIIITACANTPELRPNAAHTAEQMGVRYLLGRGVKPDAATAFYYFKQAANAGNPFAQNELAYLYFAGKGTPPNRQQAFYWYKKAAEAGLV